MPHLIADDISRLLDAHQDQGLNAHEIANELQDLTPEGPALYEIDRTPQLMQLAGWTRMDDPRGHGCRRYRLTDAGRARIEPTPPDPVDLRS